MSNRNNPQQQQQQEDGLSAVKMKEKEEDSPHPVAAYFIQVYGFIIKTLHQRRRAPIATLSTIFIPLVFVLFMGLCYWTTPLTVTPEKWFGTGSDAYDQTNVTMNFTTIVKNFFCTHPESSLPIAWPKCMAPDDSLDCIDFVGSGRDLCVPTAAVESLSGFLNALYYYSGAYTLNPMDGHLSISAFTRMEREKGHPTYFGRNARESITHYGELLVASDNQALAEEFMDFCSQKSAMCSAVLHDEVFETFEAAEDYALAHSDEVWAVVHLPGDLMTSAEDTVVFTISMNYTATPWTFKENKQALFSRPAAGAEPAVLYLASGFLVLQQYVELFVLEKHASDNALTSRLDPIRPYINEWSGTVLPMPIPESSGNEFLITWGYYLPLLCALAALFPVAALTSAIVEEKASGIREAMMIMGMHETCMFSGWYLTSLVLDIIAALLVSMVLKLGFLSSVSYGLLFVVYFTFQQQNTAFSLLMSSLFSNPNIASWCAAFFIFVFAMPFYTFPPGMRDSGKWGASTVPCVGFAFAIDQIVNHVSFDAYVDWNVVRQGEFSVVDALGMMWTSFAVMMLLALYLDQVWPAAVGRRESPFFFLRYIFGCCCCCCGKKEEPSPIAVYRRGDGAEDEENEEDLLNEHGPSTKDMIEHYDEVADPLDENVPLIFKDVTKVYISGSFIGFLYTFLTGYFRNGDYRVGLHKMSFALHRGEVTALLGTNGSGKTTVMNLATGMRTPKSGTVYVAGHNADTDFAACRRHIGYCPQRNILWDNLTVQEHLTFYARLKGTSSIDVSATVERAIHLIGLEEMQETKAGDLSGGQKRRLCVGIAIVGDSKVLFMDEPTAGLDVKGRQEVYQVIQRAREGRSVLLSTHLLDEADKLGDRLLILHNGELCGEGSPMFLKSKTNVGYRLTCVMDAALASDAMGEAAAVANLIDFVREKGGAAVHTHHTSEDGVVAIPPGCQLLGLETRGREVTFMFPLSFLSTSGRGLLEELQNNLEPLQVKSLGMTLTTLEDVFKTTTRLQMGITNDNNNTNGQGGPGPITSCPFAVPAVVATEARSSSPLSTPDDGMMMTMGEGRNVKGFIDNDPRSPCKPQSAPGTLGGGAGGGYDALNDEEKYYDTTTNPIYRFGRDFRALFIKRLHYAKRDGQLVLFQVILPIAFLALALLINLTRSPMQPAITLDMSLYNNYQSNPSEVFVTRAGNVDNVLGVTSSTPASDFGAHYISKVFEPTSPSSISGIAQMDLELSSNLYGHEHPRYVGISSTNFVIQSGIPQNSAIVFQNSTYAHTAPQALNVLFSLALSEVMGETHVAKPVVRNAPMHLGAYEQELVSTNKQVMLGMFVILAFVLIPSNTISYVVMEKACGARHLQWLTGTSMLAYWLSAFVFDVLCYVGTIVLAFLIFFAFDRKEYTGREMIGPSIVLFLFFGISATLSSYVISFFFNSPFRAQSTVLVINFVFGFLWVTMESMLADSAYEFVRYATYILRALPCVAFGEGLYVLAGTGMGWMMYPGTAHESLFRLIHFNQEGRSVFEGGVGTALIYMGCVAVVCAVALVVLEYFRAQQCSLFSRLYYCCCGGRSRRSAAQRGNDPECPENQPAPDASVREEEQRVCENATGPKEDGIVLQHLTKKYVFASGGHIALNDVSLGVHKGEVLALLGLNGAGKSTALSILSAERAPSAGHVFMCQHPLSSEECRRMIGYCPQFDALLGKLTPVEYITLFARLRGMREEHISQAVEGLVRELGLYSHRHQSAEGLSGGNRRRLSLALALIGSTTSILLDEPTAGMDAFARAQTCKAIQYLTRAKSVVLTTHLFDETEALADRVAILSRGHLQTLGTGQELKSSLSEGSGGLCVLRVHFAPHRAGGEEEEEQHDNAALLMRLQQFIKEVVERNRTTTTASQQGSSSSTVQVTVDEVLGTGVRVVVRGCDRMSVFCQLVSELTAQRVEGLPQISYVSVSQPSIEDVLLATS